MPETLFRVRWPDGTVEQCYSPSSVVSEHLTSSQNYAIADFMARARTALTKASDRVEQIYGYPCSLAKGQLATLEARQADFPDKAIVTCLDISPKSPKRAGP